jgi:hypothetical protein
MVLIAGCHGLVETTVDGLAYVRLRREENRRNVVESVGMEQDSHHDDHCELDYLDEQNSAVQCKVQRGITRHYHHHHHRHRHCCYH